MSSLLDLQRSMADVVMQPLTRDERMKQRTGNAVQVAESLMKPNDRLTGFERLEIYNRQYWFRVLDSLAEDFSGLRAIMGAKRFREMSIAYLSECPSRSYTLRDLGARLGDWLRRNPKWIQTHEQLALDMVALEWAHIEAFDAAERPVITAQQLAEDGSDLKLELQPYVRLLELHYAVDDLLLAVRKGKRVGKLVAGMLASTGAEQPAGLFVAIHRLDFSVHYKRLEPEAFRLLAALKEGCSVEQGIDRAFAGSSLSEQEKAQALEQWFAQWMSLGWFCLSDR